MIDLDIEEGSCPGCGCRVIIAKRHGQRVVLNPLPKPNGSYYFGGRGGLEKVDDRPPGDAPRFVEHSRTCPQRDLFGKGK